MKNDYRNAAIISCFVVASLSAGCAGVPEAEGIQTNASLGANSNLATNSNKTEQDRRNENILRLASDIEARGSIETALPLYRRAAAAPDANAVTHTKFADALAKLRRYGEAETAYRAALAKDPGHGPALLGLGVTLIHLGRASDAQEALTKAAPLENSASAYARLGIAHIILGQPDEALASFEHAHSMDPNDVDIATNLALATVLSGQHEEAIALATKLMKSTRLKAYHRGNLVLVLAIAGNEEDARLAAAGTLKPEATDALLKQAQELRGKTSPKERALALGMLNSTAVPAN